jgi:hypothetical protein
MTLQHSAAGQGGRMASIGRQHHILAVWLAVVVTTWSPATAAVVEKIALCHAGVVDLLSFPEDVKRLRSLSRYSKEEIEGLVEQERKGGEDFFSSQIIIQEEPSGSGTFDLRMVHGLSDAKHYTNVTACNCDRKVFPVVYFIGFRVQRIADGIIFVSREKTIVNVISLKPLDPDLNRHLKVKLFGGGKALCDDLAVDCVPEIFYERQD